MKKYLLTTAFSAITALAMAQDPQFTQFYAAPLYHNPAFAGSAHRGRAIGNYRNQWPSIPGAFVTYSASVDNYFRKYNSGAGLILTADRTGSGRLVSLGAGAQYAYEIPISRTFSARAGFEFGFKQRSLDYNQLIWRDQLNPNGQNSPGTGDPTRFRPHNAAAFDASSGLLLYSKKFWLGVSALHMNQPNVSLIAESNRILTRYVLTSGYNIPLSSSRAGSYNNSEVVRSITPVFLYQRQGNFQQASLGAYLNIQPLVIGAYYRGIPILKTPAGGMNQDAVSFLIGMKMSQYSVGYSYDLTINNIGPGTGGAHELSICYEFDTGKPFRKKHTAIPCPKF